MSAIRRRRISNAARVAVGIICALFALVIIGCTSPPPLVLGGAPEDMALDLTVLPAPGVRNEVIGSLILPAEAARYVVQPDGSLLVMTGPAVEHGQAPRRVRRLNANEMFDLWQRAQKLRFDQGEYRNTNLPSLRKTPERGVAYIIWMRAQQQEQFGRIESGQSNPDDANLREVVELIKLLDRLSWRS